VLLGDHKGHPSQLLSVADWGVFMLNVTAGRGIQATAEPAPALGLEFLSGLAAIVVVYLGIMPL